MIALRGTAPMVMVACLILIVAAIGVYYGSMTGFITFPGIQQSLPAGDSSNLVVGQAVMQGSGGGSGNAQTTANPPQQPQPPQAEAGPPKITIPTTAYSGGGGGGGGQSSPPASCSPSWGCSNWSECTPFGNRTRVCMDINQCGTLAGKPGEAESCAYAPPAAGNDSCIGVCVMPRSTSVNLTEGSNFTVYVAINTTESIYAAQFDLTFNPDLLNAAGMTEGVFLKQDGASTFCAPSGAPTVNNTEGKASYACTRIGTGAGVSGSGTMAKIDFNALSPGSADLKIENLVVTNPALPRITTAALNGTVAVTA